MGPLAATLLQKPKPTKWRNPTFHMPVFVLSHETRDPITKQGGTTYYFVTAGIESTLKQAVLAGGKDIMVLGGANAAQQYVKAGLLDEIHLTWCLYCWAKGSVCSRILARSVIEDRGVTHFRFRLVK